MANVSQFIAKALLENDLETIKAKQAASQPTEDVTMNDAGEKVELEAARPPDRTKVGAQAEPEAAEEKAPVEQSAVPMKGISGAQADNAATVKEEQKNAGALPGSAGEINFDSVLNENTGGPNEFDLDLDFGNDDMGNEAFLSGSAFNGSTGKPIQATEAEPNQSQEQNAAEDIMGPGESSFEDLFLGTEDFGDDATGDLNQLEGDSLMNINELDDNWFT